MFNSYTLESMIICTQFFWSVVAITMIASKVSTEGDYVDKWKCKNFMICFSIFKNTCICGNFLEQQTRGGSKMGGEI